MKEIICSIVFSVSIIVGTAQSPSGTDSLLLTKMILRFGNEVTNLCDTFQIHMYDKTSKKMLEFLSHDFKTDLFNNAKEFRYWYCNANDAESKRMHFGIVSVVFENENDMVALTKKIKSLQRTNFKVKVLTSFKVLKNKKELLILFSETVRQKKVNAFFKSL